MRKDQVPGSSSESRGTKRAPTNPEYDDETRVLMRERLEELEAPALRRALAE